VAFPTTGILDNFNRANEGPPPSANWTHPYYPTDDGLKVSSNACIANIDGSSDSYWDVATFGPDCEAYITVSTLPATNQYIYIAARVANPGAAGLDGYELNVQVVAGTDLWQINRLDNASYTLLGSTVTGPNLSAGDSIGIEIIGSTIKGYHKPVAGSWTEILSRTDSTYSAAGYIALGTDDAATVFDNFGGGTVAAAKARPPFQRHTNYLWRRRF
jgi:hypothetical protein